MQAEEESVGIALRKAREENDFQNHTLRAWTKLEEQQSHMEAMLELLTADDPVKGAMAYEEKIDINRIKMPEEKTEQK